MSKNAEKAAAVQKGLATWIKSIHEGNPSPALSDEDMIKTINCFMATTLRQIQEGLALPTAFPEEFATLMNVKESCRPFADRFRQDFLYTYRASPKKDELLSFVVQGTLEINALYLDSSAKPVSRMARTTSFDTFIERLEWLLGISKDKILAFLY